MQNNDLGRIPSEPGSHAAHSAASASSPVGADPLREQFIGWIADRFQERSFVPMPRDEAIEAAGGALEAFEDMEGVFGDAAFTWDEDDAHAIADDEIHAGWEFPE